MTTTPGCFPLVHWLPPPAKVFVLSDLARESAAATFRVVVGPDGEARFVSGDPTSAEASDR